MLRQNDFIISLSGVRGIYKKGLTNNKIYSLCLSVSKIFKKEGVKKILIARDTRPSGKEILEICFSTLKKQGFLVFNLGILPTPLVQSAILEQKNTAGLMITASHNPPEYNGLKFYSPCGQIFNELKIKKLISLFKKQKNLLYQDKDLPKIKISPKLDKKTYLSHFEKIFKNINLNKIKNQHFKIIIDPANGTASSLNKIFLKKLNCQVYQINSQTDGRFRRGIEPTSENLILLKNKVMQKKADLGFAQDGDADRLAVIDEKGKYLEDSLLLAMIVQHFLKNRPNEGKKVVINLATSKIIDDLVSKFMGQLFKVPVGEVNVVKKALKIKAAIAGEGHGGIIWPVVSPGRDSFSAMALFLELLTYEKEKLSKLVEKLKIYKMVKKKLKYSGNKKKLIKLMKILLKIDWPNKIEDIDKSDGLKIYFKDSWLLIRASNTEPIIRFVSEAKTKKQALFLINLAKTKYEKL